MIDSWAGVVMEMVVNRLIQSLWVLNLGESGRKASLKQLKFKHQVFIAAIPLTYILFN